MRWLLSASIAALLFGCDFYEKPNRPLPEAFEVLTLEGQRLARAGFLGKPWVINVWVPG